MTFARLGICALSLGTHEGKDQTGNSCCRSKSSTAKLEGRYFWWWRARRDGILFGSRKSAPARTFSPIASPPPSSQSLITHCDLVGRRSSRWLWHGTMYVPMVSTVGTCSICLHLHDDSCIGSTMPSRNGQPVPRSSLGTPRWSRTIQHRQEVLSSSICPPFTSFVTSTVIRIDGVNQPDRDNRHVWLRQQAIDQASTRFRMFCMTPCSVRAVRVLSSL